jgi:hypothetical protein
MLVAIAALLLASPSPAAPLSAGPIAAPVQVAAVREGSVRPAAALRSGNVELEARVSALEAALARIEARLAQAEGARAVEGAAGKPSAFGEPVSAGGARIPDEEIQRYLCFGLGNKQVESAKFQVLIEQELARRKEAGEDLSRFEVTDEEMDRYVAKQREDFLLRYPTLDFPTEVGRALLSVDLWREGARQALVFDKLFLPENPDEWPALSREVVIEWGGPGFFEDAKQTYEARKQKQIEEGLDEIPPDDPIFVDALRQTVLAALNDFARVETNPERLPAGVLMTVEGVPIRIDTIYAKIEPLVTPEVLDSTKRFLVLCRLLEDDLASKEKLLGWKEFEKLFAKDSTVAQDEGLALAYRKELNKHQMLGVEVLGFPSLEAYARYQRIVKSHERVIAEELADDQKLAAHLPVLNQITGAAKADAEVILLSAYDFDHVRWKENGWADAKRRAEELKRQIDAGADWGQMLELHSEFWDPPMPEVGQKPQFGFRFKGKWGPQTRNQLLNFMEESEYRIFLYGPSITDHVFFEQPLGTIEGPFKGPKGYYITRLISRTPPSRPLDLGQPVHRQIAEQHYAKVSLNEKARALFDKGIESGAVKGL